MKPSTRERVQCSDGNLVKAIAPAYMDNSDKNYQEALGGLFTFKVIKTVRIHMYSWLSCQAALVLQALPILPHHSVVAVLNMYR
jgi:hypothetical protein